MYEPVILFLRSGLFYLKSTTQQTVEGTEVDLFTEKGGSLYVSCKRQGIP